MLEYFWSFIVSDFINAICSYFLPDLRKGGQRGLVVGDLLQTVMDPDGEALGVGDARVHSFRVDRVQVTSFAAGVHHLEN